MVTYQQLSANNAKTCRSFLLYGASGTGKTRLACQFPRPLVLACDPGSYGGMLSGAKYGPKYVLIQTYQQYLAILPQLKQDAGKEFDTLVVDSLTYFQRITMYDILSRSGKELPRFEDWGLCQERLRNLLMVLSALPCNFVVTAVENIDKDELTGRIMGTPSVPGKLARELPQAVDACLHLFVSSGYDTQGKRKVAYKMSSAPDDIWQAKDRTETLAPELPTEFASLAHLFVKDLTTTSATEGEKNGNLQA